MAVDQVRLPGQLGDEQPDRQQRKRRTGEPLRTLPYPLADPFSHAHPQLREEERLPGDQRDHRHDRQAQQTKGEPDRQLVQADRDPQRDRRDPAPSRVRSLPRSRPRAACGGRPPARPRSPHSRRRCRLSTRADGRPRDQRAASRPRTRRTTATFASAAAWTGRRPPAAETANVSRPSGRTSAMILSTIADQCVRATRRLARIEASLVPRFALRGAGAGCLPPDRRRPGGQIASRSRAPFPSLSFGSARPPGRRYGLCQPPDPHKEGTKDERLSTRS
jgi:hypothetical protein